jgi:hypothetical protein
MTQLQLEELFSKQFTCAQLKAAIADNPQTGLIFNKLRKLNLDDDVIFAFLSAMYAQQGKPIPLQSFALKIGFQLNARPDKAAIIGLSVLGLTKHMGMFDVTDGGQIRPIKLSSERIRQLLMMKAYLPPMIVKPKDPKNPYRKVKFKMILSKEPAIEDKELHEKYPVDVLRKLNSVAWRSPRLYDESNDQHPQKRMRDVVRLAVEDGAFYFTHSYDFRGRVYANGYHLTYQGTPHDKAAVEFDYAAGLTDDGLDFLLIDYANHLGKGKLNYKDRIDEALRFHHEAGRDEKLLEGLGDKTPLILKAKHALTMFGLHQPVMHSVSLDASASGLQLMSILARDETGMELTNVTSKTFNDPYGKVCEILNANAGTNYERSQVKLAIMTTSYNSLASPQKTFGKHYDAYMDAYNLCFAGAGKIMKLFNKFFNAGREIHSWVMPDGFTVHMPTYQQKVKKYQSVWGTLDFMSHEVSPNKDQWRSLVPNIIHSIDAWVCRETIRNFKQPFIATVHDCFRVHPNHARELQLAYNCALMNLYNSNMLEYLVAQLKGEPIGFKYFPEERLDILLANYAIS